MTGYLFAKYLHVTCVVISLAGFAARGALMLADSPWLQARPVRIAPHIIDTMLLGSAAWLSWRLAQYPFVQGWITAKVAGLILYIALGTIALRKGRTRTSRALALAGALAAAAYIVSVALTRSPLGAAAWLS